MTGRVIAVVGPSGVGKDSVMRGMVAAAPDLQAARRVITRPRDDDSEDFESVDAETFEARCRAGDFVLDWSAHGLRYGIPAGIRDEIAAGRDLLVNLSRGVLDAAHARFPRFVVLSLTADPEVLAHRLAGRGREDAEGIARRLARANACLDTPAPVITIDNSGTLDDTVRRAINLLYPTKVT